MKRLYIPLPDAPARLAILRNLLYDTVWRMTIHVICDTCLIRHRYVGAVVRVVYMYVWRWHTIQEQK